MYKRISLALLLSYCAIQSAAAQQTLRFGVDPTFPTFKSIPWILINCKKILLTLFYCPP